MVQLVHVCEERHDSTEYGWVMGGTCSTEHTFLLGDLRQLSDWFPLLVFQ
jgi:hypothetical protein